MKTSSITFGLLLAASLGGRASAAVTTYGVGTQALPLQQSGGSARAMGMGSAVVAVAQDSASLLWNPAGLSRMDDMEIAVHHNSGLGDTLQEIFVFGMPLGEVKKPGQGGTWGGLAASFGYVDYGSIPGADATGQTIANYSPGDYSGSLGWGLEVIRGLSAGIAMKGNRSDFGHHSYNTYSTDMGLMWKALPTVDLGASYSNLKMLGGIGDQSSGLRLGAGWTIDERWLLAASTELQSKAMKRLQLGGEYRLGAVGGKDNVLALRGGYQFSFPSRELGAFAGLSIGLGYTVTHAFAVDYAFLPAGDLGESHRLSLTYKFDSSHR